MFFSNTYILAYRDAKLYCLNSLISLIFILRIQGFNTIDSLMDSDTSVHNEANNTLELDSRINFNSFLDNNSMVLEEELIKKLQETNGHHILVLIYSLIFLTTY